ncbi:hypothetical protein [Isoptericola sediminis]|uniref:ABC transporter family protein n=1 Tax=Isoptericola sediminis TaxID=2733572 RepID=A0A849K2R8_9MICO|nr:hypothetical protein [Isoptericola sediminis]NNU26085.1 hypothetical protein [Isoptericola sediminis]
MRITVDGVRADGRREPMLTSVGFSWATGEALLAAAEPGHGHTALALVATGRFVPSAGTVRLDGAEATSARLRRISAVVDVPGLNDPDDALTLADVVAEGLALAGRRSWPRDVARWLDAHGLTPDRGRRVDQLPGAVRTAVLAGLAVADPEVRFVVLTLPDRHGGDPADWWDLARSLAVGGTGVLVQCTRSSARDLGVDLPAAVGDTLHAPPRVVRREVLRPSGPDPEVEPEGDPGTRQDTEPAEAEEAAR